MQPDSMDLRATHNGELTRELARFVADTQWRDVPVAVRSEAKRSLVNYFAVALAGCHDPTLDKAVSVYSRFSANDDATVIGRSERSDMLNAAALNAMSANVYDFDDAYTHHHSSDRASRCRAVRARRVARAERRSVAARVRAWRRSGCRIGNAVSPEHYRRGYWHITSTCGVFGAAAAVAKALFARRTRDRVGARQCFRASGRSCGNARHDVEKHQRGQRGAQRLVVARYWRNGRVSGPDAPLEGERGFVRVATPESALSALTQDLGREWALLKNTYKPYPVWCRVESGDRRVPRLAPRRARWSFSTISNRSNWQDIRCCASAPTGQACARGRESRG